MKIEIESLDELCDLIGVMSPDFLRAWNPGLDNKIKVESLHTTQLEVIDAQEKCGLLSAVDAMERRLDLRVAEDAPPDGLPTDIPAPLAASMDAAVAATSAALREEVCQLDADGVAHNTDWHSEPAKINADGRWKARRGRDNDAYSAWLLSLAVEVAEAAVAADAEPVATETHALPQDALPDDSGPIEVRSGHPMDTGELPQDEPEAQSVDLQALVAASFDQAASQSTDVRELLNAAQAFTTAHGHAKFNELKSAVAPIDGNPFGKALQLFTPEERQLMMACLANYPSN